ncbi:DUF1826 domain-containing protein [Stutzerimonas nosocomialis]|uniref:DUF1826 domain-containing protein n=1 Tax=Stutzerimonas nosocomialis TaxID=1056496 RepID=A0A5R9QGD1_9GAMM|nr:DUF1826 domain-containing protein [Stutzerimonas nosocomialis]TLX52999.1 DUF1826 domain-containing protein [Stutzerimonas nosocomialis]TLX64259.1 DUF1826 domain-containing protein [Stutzerimonas nosocomialis]
MLARQRSFGPQQRFGDAPAVLGEALREGVNLAVWRRALSPQLRDFCQAVAANPAPLAESRVLDVAGDAPCVLESFATACRGLDGYPDFIDDVTWLTGAFACLVDARRVGVRLRLLDQAMCPRFHVDHVPLRLITTYVGTGSQWLREETMPRQRLGDPAAEPVEARMIEQLPTGAVALFKGEKWQGNEGAGIIHRSPPSDGGRRLILTLDWLA